MRLSLLRILACFGWLAAISPSRALADTGTHTSRIEAVEIIVRNHVELQTALRKLKPLTRQRIAPG